MKSLLTLLGVLFLIHGHLTAQIVFTNRNDLLAEKNLHSGVPVALADMNGDGLDDIVALDEGHVLVIQYQTPDPDRPFVRYEVARNVDNAEQNDICIADFNNDGANDILTVGSYDRVKVFYAIPNTYEYQLAYVTVIPFFSQGASAGDFNHDGWVDVVLLNDNGTNYTLMNDGTGTLVQQELFDWNTVPPSDNSGNYGSVYTDFDMDGDLDFYIAKCRQGVNNPADPRRINTLFVNDGLGNYQQDAATYGLANGRQTWTADFGDIDNDGDLDCFMTQHDVVSELYENINNDTFVDITNASGLAIGGIPLQGMFRDFDNDGFQDILVSGDRLDFYRNNGDKTFSKQNPFGSIVFGTFGLGDLNQDGFTDIYASRVIPFNNPDLLREDILYLGTPNGNHFLSLDVLNEGVNPSAIGAMALLYGPWGVQVREVRGGEQYGVSNSLKMIFGLGQETAYDSLVIRWPDGVNERYDNLAVDKHWTLRRGGCAGTSLPMFDSFKVLCEGESIVLKKGELQSLVTWSTGETTDSITVSASGLYYAVFTDLNGCYVRTIPLEVTSDPDSVRPQILYEGKTALCDGEIATLTLSNGLSYLWSNGAQSVTIDAHVTGDYYATVQGYCKVQQTDTLHLDFVVPVSPSGEPDTFKLGETAELFVSGDNIIWYSNAGGSTVIGDGNALILQDLTETTIVFAQSSSTIPGSDFQAGPVTQAGNNKYNATFVNGGQIFTVEETVVLNQVTMYTDTVGRRVIEITSNSGFFFDKEVDLAAGTTVVDLNVELPPDEYTISTNTDVNNAEYGVNSPYLWRSSSGILYPYAVIGILSIDNSTFGEDFYYYFYDWKFSTKERTCYSALVPVTAFLDTGVAVDPVSSYQKLVVNPNPTSGWVTFDTGEGMLQRVALMSLDGRTLLQQEHHFHSAQKGNLDMSEVQPGMYILRMVIDGKLYSGKIIRL